MSLTSLTSRLLRTFTGFNSAVSRRSAGGQLDPGLQATSFSRGKGRTSFNGSQGIRILIIVNFVTRYTKLSMFVKVPGAIASPPGAKYNAFLNSHALVPRAEPCIESQLPGCHDSNLVFLLL